MKLTRTERLVLANQARILESLYPKEAGHWQTVRKVLEEGFALEYPMVFGDMHDDKGAMTEGECREVLDILAMHVALQRAYAALDDKSGIADDDRIRFRGFDGNEETKQMAYVRFLRDREHKYNSLNRGDDFNSHMPVLGLYRRMLVAWNTSSDKYNLTKADIERITSA